MANLLRGQVPFSASGRDLFLCYGNRELAEAQAALGFRRPDPQLPDVAEEVDVPVRMRGEDRQVGPQIDAAGLPVFRRDRILVDHAERQRRMIAGFEAVLMNPDPEAMLRFFRIGLGPWERANAAKLSDEQFHDIVRAVGLVRMKEIHYDAIRFGAYLRGEDEETDEGKAASAASASST